MSKNTKDGTRTRALLATLSMGLLVPGCDTPFHILVSEEGRPMRVYEDPYSCQVAAVWYQERGHETECVVMSRAKLSQFRLDLQDEERMP